MIDLSTCPVLATPMWSWEDLAVAADWALARGVKSAADMSILDIAAYYTAVFGVS